MRLRVNNQIELVLPSIKDAPQIFALVKNREYLREFLGWVDYSKSQEDTEEFLRSNLPLWQKLEALHLSIYKNNILIGSVG